MLLALFRSGIMFAFGSWSHKHPWDWPGGCSSCLLAYGLYYTLLDWQKKTTALFALCVRGYGAIGRGLSSCSRVSAIYPAALFRLKLHKLSLRNYIYSLLLIFSAKYVFRGLCFACMVHPHREPNAQMSACLQCNSHAACGLVAQFKKSFFLKKGIHLTWYALLLTEAL